ncbi:hypothetical protein PCC7424_1549 [Gloeothece citriformis PCC 7424]|uniref:Uncharacterized protein n=1 Tax=Gloeothece citriformis (strain PCC 7424) TaxID=65393 RepID=B7K9M1_GLOC7|nr:hypothetical protein [Gloeothece citriformis]ACK69989.1 hypothetical protein PCC7424_1549 [Gloeothece citriformis PCC 7424]
MRNTGLDATPKEYLYLRLANAPEYPYNQSYHWAGFSAIGQVRSSCSSPQKIPFVDL